MTEIEISYEGELRTSCTHLASGQVIATDAPRDNQGRGEGFSPTDLMAAALGSCTLTVMGIVARKMGVDLEGVVARVHKEMTVAPEVRRIKKLTLEISLPFSPDDSVRQRLEKAALECPVHHSLHPAIEVLMSFQWRQDGKSSV